MADHGKPKTIKFDQKSDEDIRANAKKIHELAMLLKEAGFLVRTISGRVTSFELRKAYKLPRKNSYSLIEFVHSGDDKNAEIQDWITINTKVKVINSGIYKYGDGVEVFHLIADCN